jgi:hypothetical protein
MYPVSTGTAGHEAEAMEQQSDGLQRLGRYSGAAVVFSVVACYGTLATITLLSLAGITLNIHEGAWATVIVVFAWIAVLAMGVNRQRYGTFVPFILADIGALLVSWVMFVDYSRTVEIAGFALLIVAALLDRRLRMRRSPQPQNSQQGTD